MIRISPYAYRQMAVKKHGEEKGNKLADEYQKRYYESKNKPSAKETQSKSGGDKSKEKFHDPLKSYLKKEEEEIRKLEKEKSEKKEIKKKDTGEDREMRKLFRNRLSRW